MKTRLFGDKLIPQRVDKKVNFGMLYKLGFKKSFENLTGYIGEAHGSVGVGTIIFTTKNIWSMLKGLFL